MIFAISITGGTGPYSYTLLNTMDGIPFGQSELSIGTYTENIPTASTGTFAIELTVQDQQCSVEDSKTVTVKSAPNASWGNTPNGALCSTDPDPSLEVLASNVGPNGILTYTTPSGELNVNITDAGTMIQASESGSYTLTSIRDDVCARNILGESYTLILQDPQSTTLTKSQETICSDQSESVTFTADVTPTYSTDVYSYSWLVNGTPYPSFDNLNPITLNLPDQPINTISVEISGGGACGDPSVGSTNITVVERPVGTIAPGPREACANEGESIVLEVQNPNPDLTYRWEHNGQTVSAATALTLEEANQSGSYTLFTQNQDCTPRETSTEVTITQVQVAGTIRPESLLQGEPITLSVLNPSSGYSYDWSGPSITSTEEEVTISGSITAQYPEGVIQYKLEGGTESCREEITLETIIRSEISIPHVFSPNGDLQNDNWEINGIGTYQNAQVRVYNRWGNVVWEKTNGYQGEFQGISKSGSPLPASTYYYSIELGEETSGNKPTVYSGYVMIIR
jgi:gliding motility-associated-like protein